MVRDYLASLPGDRFPNLVAAGRSHRRRRPRRSASSCCSTSSSMDSPSGRSERRDSRGLAVLATGHLWADFLPGRGPGADAVPDRRARLLLRARRGRCCWPSSVGSSLDPAAVRRRLGPPLAAVADAGRASRRRRRGSACVGLDANYRGDRRRRGGRAGSASPRSIPRARATRTTSQRAGSAGAGMSMFSLGGNAGFALGPLLMTPAVLAFGLHGTRAGADPAVARRRAAGRASCGRLRAFAPAPRGAGRTATGRRSSRDDWGPFARLAVGRRAALGDLLRPAGVRAGLLRASSWGRARRPATRALSVMLVAGAARDLRRRAAGRPARAGAVILVGSMARAGAAARRVPARRPLAGDGAAGGDRASS